VRLSVERLVVKRGERTVLDGVSCAVEAGTAVVLSGPNGAGKTTLIRTIAGFLTPAAGTIALDGGDPELDVAQQCHLVGHANGIKPALTVEDNVMFWAAYLDSDGNNASRVETAISALSLNAIRTIEAAYLSAGQKRRVGLARLLVAERPLWLLDEPTVSLDAASTLALAALINAHTAKGGIAIVATHVPIGLERVQDLKLTAARVLTAASEPA
jgi:heme exporter protein A